LTPSTQSKYNHIINWIDKFTKYLPSYKLKVSSSLTLNSSSSKSGDYRRGIFEGERLNFDKKIWDNIAKIIKSHKGKLGDLGSGNHFLEAMIDIKTNELYFLCHTGSRDESKKIQEIINKKNYKNFHKLYKNTRQWALENRNTIISFLKKEFGNLETIVHKDHNHYEIIDNKMIIRKGAVKITAGEKTIIPSHMTGEAIIVKATDKISKTFNSLSHGTGRIMSRSDAKNIKFDFNKELREKIYIPTMIKNESLRTESPFVYRNINTVSNMLNELIIVENKLKPIAYIGQL